MLNESESSAASGEAVLTQMVRQGKAEAHDIRENNLTCSVMVVCENCIMPRQRDLELTAYRRYEKGQEDGSCATRPLNSSSPSLELKRADGEDSHFPRPPVTSNMSGSKRSFTRQKQSPGANCISAIIDGRRCEFVETKILRIKGPCHCVSAGEGKMQVRMAVSRLSRGFGRCGWGYGHQYFKVSLVVIDLMSFSFHHGLFF